MICLEDLCYAEHINLCSWRAFGTVMVVCSVVLRIDDLVNRL